ncbi:AvrD family protein [Sphingobacterium hungaricum]|uniref:Avirulence D protein (AvrD) n=1 Tax=Sphingobacterium hungaricum TaxID=2082723 RepID=A0A928YRB8_9SPHI|nr:AvrD family protein [Sphingobacterium hungaricum]MBE8714824.1 hypothetical protein [Sphingobacterium hungaricum]
MHTFFHTTDEVLGDARNRYFGRAFQAYHIKLKSFIIDNSIISGVFKIDYDGPARPRHETVHLGSIEYTALALLLAGFGLSKLVGLSIEQINMATLDRMSFKISSILCIGEVSFAIQIKESGRDNSSKQGSYSTFQLTVGFTTISIRIDHQGKRYHWLTAHQSLDPFSEQLYTIGYKKRTLKIHTITLNLHSNSIQGHVHCPRQYPENEIDGLSSSRSILLPTDALQVFGQLMQTLLYQKMNSNREQCPNIWLRRMDLEVHAPQLEEHCISRISFDKIKRINQRKESWQMIDLSGNVGTYRGKFQIAHKLS